MLYNTSILDRAEQAGLAGLSSSASCFATTAKMNNRWRSRRHEEPLPWANDLSAVFVISLETQPLRCRIHGIYTYTVSCKGIG